MHFDTRTNMVDVYVRYLRRKLGEHIIETVPRVGYRLRGAPGAAAQGSREPLA
jgi:DNA-binding response OmpR family regulator